uniref:SFRICE_028378 n=1 Tax=Spodoptera frugiperda TaxID=7108 RepID=A0A2H1WAC2_SPOFR
MLAASDPISSDTGKKGMSNKHRLIALHDQNAFYFAQISYVPINPTSNQKLWRSEHFISRCPLPKGSENFIGVTPVPLAKGTCSRLSVHSD